MNIKSQLILAPLLVTIMCPVPVQLSQDARMQLVVDSGTPSPPPVAIYGRPSRARGTPMSSPLDNYYSGAYLRPHDLDHWYGNGYNY
jgi:hypothetical protein